MAPEKPFKPHRSNDQVSETVADDLLTVLEAGSQKDSLEQQTAELFRAWRAGEIGQREYMRKVDDLGQVYDITHRHKARKALDRINNDSPRKRFGRSVLNLFRRS